jgi:hypothetical protein
LPLAAGRFALLEIALLVAGALRAAAWPAPAQRRAEKWKVRFQRAGALSENWPISPFFSLFVFSREMTFKQFYKWHLLASACTFCGLLVLGLVLGMLGWRPRQ